MRYVEKTLIIKKVPVDADGNTTQVETGLEVPQYDSVDEFVAAAPSEEVALSWLNRNALQDAVRDARTHIMQNGSKTNGKETQITSLCEAAQTKARGFAPSIGRGPGKAEKLQDFDNILSQLQSGEEVDMTALAEQLEGMSKKYR